MKKITAYIMAMVLLLTVYNVQKSYGQDSATMKLSAAETTGSTQTVEPSATAVAGSQEEQKAETEIEPLLSEKIDTSRQGIVMSLETEFSSEVTKGDDGSCYYFRTEQKEGKKKIVFYKNNGVKVCETTMNKIFEKKKYKKNKYYISTFVKCGDYFFLAVQSPYTDKALLTTVDIETGKWGSMVKVSTVSSNVIIYDNHFYYIEHEREITVYDLSGKKTYLGDVSPKKLPSSASVRCIVDDKIYYTSYDYIMRCNLKGKKKETLFECNDDIIGEDKFIPSYCSEMLRIDGDYIYVLATYHHPFDLIRIPLYGGKVEKVAENMCAYFELSEDSIFFLSGNNGNHDSHDYIYKIDKGLTSEPVAVTKSSHYVGHSDGTTSNLFHCADGHLIVQGYNEKERKTVNGILYSGYFNWALWGDVTANYAPDWYWVSEDGTIEDTIKGSGVKKKWEKYVNK